MVLDPSEHDDVRVLPPQEWRPLIPQRVFARLSAVAEARRTGVAAYVDRWDWGTGLSPAAPPGSSPATSGQLACDVRGLVMDKQSPLPAR